jgi:hypothetical protein
MYYVPADYNPKHETFTQSRYLLCWDVMYELHSETSVYVQYPCEKEKIPM